MFSRSDLNISNNINYEIYEELCSDTLSVNEDEEFYTNCENNSWSVNNFNEDSDDAKYNDNIKYNIIISMICLKYYVKTCLPDLPKSAKMFLKTISAEYYIENISEVQESQFVYFEIIKYLQTMINTNLHIQNIIELLINVDGVPLFRSGSKQLWPILCKVYFQSDVYEPFPIAIYCVTNHVIYINILNFLLKK